jgi:hypothetical protein
MRSKQPVFRRNKSGQESVQDTVAPKPKTGGKGRPTPTRKEAEAARKAAYRKPRNRREATRLQRERSRAERVRVHEAMKSGDDRYLPAPDKGQVRRLARDYVDARRSVMEYALPVLLVVSFGGILLQRFWPFVAAATNIFFMLMILAIAVDWILLTRGLKKKLAQRLPGQDTKGAGFYAVRRTMQMRRWRLPKPMVSRGTKL